VRGEEAGDCSSLLPSTADAGSDGRKIHYGECSVARRVGEGRVQVSKISNDFGNSRTGQHEGVLSIARSKPGARF